jgi:predicted amidohydrolase YtcJ
MYYFNMDLEARTAVQLAGHYADRYESIGGKWLIRSTVFRRSSLATYRLGVNGELHCTGMGRNDNALGPAL